MWPLALCEHGGGMSEETIEMSPAPPAVKLLRRSADDRIIGGVCAGLGRYWNVDPVVLRVVFAVSLLLGGIGLFAYLALWLLVPEEGTPPPAKVTQSWGLRILGGFTVLIAAGIGLGLLFGGSPDGGGVLMAALLAGVAVWIVMSQRGGSRAAVEPSEPVPTGYAYGGTGGYAPTTVLQAPPPPVMPPRPRSYLGLIGLCAAVVAGGVAMLLGASATTVLSAVLLVLGLTLLVGAFYGRAKWLLIFAVPLALLLGIVGQVQRMDLNVGAQTWSPTPTDTVRTVGAGSVRMDLSQWPTAPQRDEVSIEMGFGQLDVNVPRNWTLEMIPDFGAVEVSVDGPLGRASDSRSFGPSDSPPARMIYPAIGDSDGTLVLRVSMGAGQVRIHTGSPAVAASVPLPTPTKKEKAA